MNIRYLSLALAFVVALSGCGGGDSSSETLEKPVNDTLTRQEPASFAGSYGGVIGSALKDFYNTSLSMSTIVNNDGEFWMTYSNLGFIHSAESENLTFGLIHGKFEKSDALYIDTLSTNATDYSFTSHNTSSRLIDFDLGGTQGAEFTFFDTMVYEDPSYPEGFTELVPYSVYLDYDQGNSTDQLKDYEGVYQGALVTTHTSNTASMVTNTVSTNKMGYSIIDEQGCIIEGDISFDPKSIYLRADGNVNSSADTCLLEEGAVHGLVSKDDDNSKVLILVSDDNNDAYVFSVSN